MDTLVPKPDRINQLVEAQLVVGKDNTKQLHARLARLCGCSTRSIEDVRRYEKAVSERMLFHLAEFFRVPLAEIAVLPPGYKRHHTPIEGRDEEIGWLEKLWRDPKVAVVSVSGMGGEGKTALADEFIETLPHHEDVHVHRADFYRKTTASAFLTEFVSRCEPSAPRVSDERALVSAAVKWMTDGRANFRHLLVLEGFEELMTGRGEDGPVIGDSVMREFLHTLAQSPRKKRSGMVLITSREPLNELAQFRETFRELELPPLETASAERLFWRLLEPGASSAPKEVSADAVTDFVISAECHALTIILAAHRRGPASRSRRCTASRPSRCSVLPRGCRWHSPARRCRPGSRWTGLIWQRSAF